ncbi:MAG: hypothetical protein U0441_06470 [Polyangiaceae bacterium]
MNPTAYLASIAALGLSLFAGCGGNVVLDNPSGSSDGGGGGGGSGGGTTGTTGTTVTTTSGVTTTPTSTSSYCKGVCAAALQYGCFTDGDLASCIDSCESLFQDNPKCGGEITALYDCAVQALPSYGCDGLEQACPMQMQEYSNCVGGVTTCGSNGCVGDQYSCSCTGDCNGYTLEVDCKGQPGTSTVDCQCLQDGNYVGSCQDNNLSCDMFGCCAAYFPI